MSEEFPTLTLSLPPEHAGQRLDQALAQLWPQFSRSRLQHWMASGALQVGTGLRAGYSERINARERIGLNASYDIQEGLGGGGSTTFLSVTPSYSVQLGPNVAANAAYSVQRNDAGDVAQSLNFTLSRDFNLPF